MQLQMDWARRDRCAQQIDSSLKEIGVCLSQRAAVVVVFSHERSTLAEKERQIMFLKISYREAADWVRNKSDLYRNLELHPSTLHDAVRSWAARDVMHAEGTRPTTLMLSGTALRDWHAGNVFDPTEFARTWTHKQTHVGKCSDAFGGVRGCSGPSHHSERVSEGDSFNQEQINHSLTHSTGALPALPVEIWDHAVSEKRLYEAVGAWWIAEGLADRSFDPNAVLGAILAARRNKATSPQTYVESCLSRGVSAGWIQQAAAMRRRCRSNHTPIAAAIVPKTKTPRMIGPGIQPGGSEQ